MGVGAASHSKRCDEFKGSEPFKSSNGILVVAVGMLGEVLLISNPCVVLLNLLVPPTKIQILLPVVLHMP